MKKIIFVLSSILLMASCSMEKRVHMSGYHMEWNNKKYHPAKNEITGNDNSKKDLALVDKSENISNTNENANKAIEDNISVSIENDKIIIPQTEKYNLKSSQISNKIEEEEEIKASFRSEFKKGANKIIKYISDDPKTNGMAIAGFVCSLVGLFLFGFILGVLAIIFSAIGLGKINKEPSKWKGRGLAIAGLIVGIIDIAFWIILLGVLLSGL